MKKTPLIIATLYFWSPGGWSQNSGIELPGAPQRPYQQTEQREPCASYDPLRRPHFGDTHVHTTFSFDANSQDTRNNPGDAYNFARGGRMGIQPYDENGEPLRHIKLDRPLDFAAVTDHAEFLGEIRLCTTPGSDGYWHPVCFAHRHFPSLTFATLAAYGLTAKNRWSMCGDKLENCSETVRSVWKEVQDYSEQAYDRSSDCSFTSFVGYEWTGTVGAGKNLHHNVIFRNEKVPDYPLSWIESPSSVNLWDYLERECVENTPGCDAVFIPHNSNLSGGLMFQSARVSEDAIPAGRVTAAEARRRAHWEPLFEIMQHKGSSECDNRSAWVEDEFCGFEKLGYDSFGGKNTGMAAGGAMDWLIWFTDEENLPQTRLPDPNNFMRWALKEGLRQQQELGVNSFKFGIIASTDTHIAAPGLTAERNHPGHGGAGMGSREGIPLGLPDELEYSPGGLAVLWAEENTRDALFAAMRRREAYGTSGTRPVLRFFGGWDYPEELCAAPDMVARGYAGGVPMGGDLQTRPPGMEAGPRFLVSAVQDPGSPNEPGTPLQRIQLIKGWYANGELHEQVLDVAGGANDASVELSSCEQHGVGHAQLCSVWQDDNFDPSAQAFYYARVLENPSCRWSQHICVAAKVSCDDPATVTEGLEGCCAPEHQPVQQERAWSSPIWYTPPG
ncbi:MAG: DUF3604 domain-containing protein [Gammaproteobacteria bacterium]|nr:DUF3604 domain-containing protein [Gammaproteobacteria bacterium]